MAAARRRPDGRPAARRPLAAADGPGRRPAARGDRGRGRARDAAEAPDRRGEGLGADAIEDLAHLPTSDPQHLSAADASRLTGGLPALQDDLALLADLGIPETLQPNDVNPRNACGPDEAAALRFFDLGDAFWSHPFAALHLPMRLAAGLDLAAPLPSAPAAVRVAEAYLARWPEAPRRRWAAVVRAADRLGAVHRAASWQRLLAPVDPARLGLPTPRIADWLAAALRPAAGPDLGAAGRGRLPA